MNIHAVGHAYGHSPAHEGRRTGDAPEETTSAGATGSQEPAAIEAVAGEGDGDHEKGVLRLLAQGHFKGVANLRLHINFFDEIQAMELAAAGPVVDGKVAEILDAVRSGLEGIGTGADLSEEDAAALADLRESFEDAVGGLLADFHEAGSPDIQGLVEAIRSAFDALVASLGDLGAAEEAAGAEALEGADPEEEVISAESTGAGEPVASEDAGAQEPLEGAESASVLAALIEDLEATFTGLLKGFTDSVAAASVFAEPSPPTGNGVAYEKFLAIYNEMRGVGAPEVEAQDPV